jgi:predicted O-methyltransferase YrrM
MLRLLVEATGARNVVEIGTSNGYSGLWFSLALSKTGGHLTTFDINKGRFEMARDNFKKAGVDGTVTQVLGDAHREVARLKDPIDLLFIDADKQGYLDYLTKLLPLVRPGGLILAHNMASPRPDPAFVKAITTNPELETLFVNMNDQGLGITLKKR